MAFGLILLYLCQLQTTDYKPQTTNHKPNPMPGFELFGEEERKEVNDVLETGILMRYGFDGPRKGIWKAKELEQELPLGATYIEAGVEV